MILERIWDRSIHYPKSSGFGDCFGDCFGDGFSLGDVKEGYSNENGENSESVEGDPFVDGVIDLFFFSFF